MAKTKGRKKRTTSKKGRKSRRKRRRVRINKDGTVNKQELKLPSLASMMRDNPWMKQAEAELQAKKGGRSRRFRKKKRRKGRRTFKQRGGDGVVSYDEFVRQLALFQPIRVGCCYWTSCRRAGSSLAVTGEGLWAVSRQTS